MAVKTKRKRIQIYFEEDMVDTIDLIQERTGLPNLAEVLRLGIRWFEFCIDLMADGNEFIVKHPDGSASKLMMPFKIASTSRSPAGAAQGSTRRDKSRASEPVGSKG